MSHMEKMSQFASQADSFINAALDQLDDAVEQAVMPEGGAGSEAIAKHALSASKLSEVRAAVSFWSDLDVDARREVARRGDADDLVQGVRRPRRRALADAARAAHAPDASEAHRRRSSKPWRAVKALTSRVEFAETAFMSMLNDSTRPPIPPPPSPPPPTPPRTSPPATERRRGTPPTGRRSQARWPDESAAANAPAAAELAALRAAFDDKVEAIARERLADAEARASSAEAAAETARRAAARAESDAAEARRDLDASRSRVFDLEEARTADIARASEAEAEAASSEAEGARRREAAALGECQRLRRETRRLRQRLEGAPGETIRGGDESRSEAFDALDGGKIVCGVDAASLRERLAVQKSVVAQLKAALEDAESAAERDAAEFRAAAEHRADETERLRTELAAIKAESASRPTPEAFTSMETRIRTLLALVDAEDGDALDAAAAAAANGDEKRAARRRQGRNRRLAADLAEARREAVDAREAAERAGRARRGGTPMRREGRRGRGVGKTPRRRHGRRDGRPERVETPRRDVRRRRRGGRGRAVRRRRVRRRIRKNTTRVRLRRVRRGASSRRGGPTRQTRASRRGAGRVGEVESELEKARADAAKLRADNIGLFDKVKYLQTFYAERHTSGPGTRVVRVDADGVPAPTASARYGCGFGGVSVAVDGAGPLGALARKRAAKFGSWGRGRGARDAASFEDVPGGDAEGLLGRYAEASAAARATERPGGARERPKGRMVRAFFVVYFALVHAFLARVLVSSATARSRA